MLLYATPVITAYVLVLTAIVGLVMGSFLNCWAWRITHHESIMHGRSHCTTCNRVLGARDLIPVFSWLCSKGTCRYCGQSISARYPLTELFCAIVFVSIVMRYDISLEAAQLLCFASILLVLSLTDLDDYIIPNGCIIAAIIVRVLYIVASGLLVGTDMLTLALDSLLGGVAVFVPLLLVVLVADKLLGRDSMGGGDLKLFFVAGLYFGWQQCLFLVIVACVIGIVLALIVPAESAENLQDSQGASQPDEADSSSLSAKAQRLIPFGPSIALACWITCLCGGPLVSWYLGLF